jgi:hypothetical protein
MNPKTVEREHFQNAQHGPSGGLKIPRGYTGPTDFVLRRRVIRLRAKREIIVSRGMKESQ